METLQDISLYLGLLVYGSVWYTYGNLTSFLLEVIRTSGDEISWANPSFPFKFCPSWRSRTSGPVSVWSRAVCSSQQITWLSIVVALFYVVEKGRFFLYCQLQPSWLELGDNQLCHKTAFLTPCWASARRMLWDYNCLWIVLHTMFSSLACYRSKRYWLFP